MTVKVPQVPRKDEMESNPKTASTETKRDLNKGKAKKENSLHFPLDQFFSRVFLLRSNEDLHSFISFLSSFWFESFQFSFFVDVILAIML
jgi:hypothetical protein